ncbi:MAG: preprotein translocase subunit SecE [Candidatus Marinimicrobia bacterium]|jgi:preprotein translocase SecE subunit|nr:preprotein translocase subunit SecE [Candidatus Neomarinimicrobiota bacterium]MBT3950994.1 preprotein translocase subunit SecE [Candidatus Neomarinimicrobiota bacterium]MBT4297108.1 preprotein translocase subunit SecE [Candidatus Neomarinimicrobiota bacterium]MBT5465614.1 preprotein translocase subunit SecE [Candidatus Neomarinimicrobiota bacterium]MBT6003904.1 preprotein translocase subunit SecE [Candidatus Neomarinimicrobiota bacterium]
MINKLKAFLDGVQVEFKKISWPSYEELKSSTWVVLGMSALIAVILFTLDKVMSVLILNVIMGR